MSHADHMLSAVDHMNRDTDSFMLRAFPSIAQLIFDCYAALSRSLADITLARRRNILSGASDNMYLSEFRNAPLADTQLFVGVTLTALEKSSKNTIVWHVLHSACASQLASRRPRLSHYSRPAPSATFTPTATRGSCLQLYCQQQRQTSPTCHYATTV